MIIPVCALAWFAYVYCYKGRGDERNEHDLS
jgi:hypothetical protein